jgi:glutamate formiminotransferase
MSAAPLFAVVPNFSEGRRAHVIDAIVASLRVPGARVVFAEADPDHNRLDTTVLGEAEAVRGAALASARVAVGLIDMTSHRGGHPRMGAVDVIPFVPLGGATMDDAVALARGSARELAETLELPVYLYDRAALLPERASLADVRRGEFEALRDAVARGERLPDLGPHVIGRAGATAVGARGPLIAFNLYLRPSGDGPDPASDALAIAETAAAEIARTVRESGGGLPAVRAIGFAVPERGLVTVSMNLVDHEVTGLAAAYDAVEAEASARGLVVVDSEIVGLAPDAALGPGVAEHVRLVGFDPSAQVLERLAEEDP